MFEKLTSRSQLPSLLIALCALMLVLLSFDAAGDYPANGEGTGVTVDEIFNVQEGVRLDAGLQEVMQGTLGLKELFSEPEDFPVGQPSESGYHNPDHPPLGRLWIGFWHSVATTFFPSAHQLTPFSFSAARVASAIAFALTVFLIASIASKWYGSIAGVIAGTSLILMPRLFGHAHIASLETITNLMFTTTVLLIADRWKPGETISWKNILLAGVLLGLTFLTKIQAILLPVPIACWVAWNWGVFKKSDLQNETFVKHWGRNVLLPYFCLGAIAFVVFFILWPWLWIDPVEHLKQYFGRTTNRASLYVWYFGKRYVDKQVPWHYPWVMFLLTVPLGLLVLGKIGLWKKKAAWKEPREQLLLGCLLFPLILFSLPGVAVYDGVRLFLVLFPLWGIFIGKGGAVVIGWMVKRMSPRIAVPLFAIFLLSSAWGIYVMSPCYLSYYNGLLTKTTADNSNVMEKDYWGTAITRGMLEEIVKQVPKGSTIEVTPVLVPMQLAVMLEQSPILRKHQLKLQAYQPGRPLSGRYVLFFSRLADLPEEFRHPLPENGKLLVETKRGGDQLAGFLYFK